MTRTSSFAREGVNQYDHRVERRGVSFLLARKSPAFDYRRKHDDLLQRPEEPKHDPGPLMRERSQIVARFPAMSIHPPGSEVGID